MLSKAHGGMGEEGRGGEKRGEEGKGGERWGEEVRGGEKFENGHTLIM